MPQCVPCICIYIIITDRDRLIHDLYVNASAHSHSTAHVYMYALNLQDYNPASFDLSCIFMLYMNTFTRTHAHTHTWARASECVSTLHMCILSSVFWHVAERHNCSVVVDSEFCMSKRCGETTVLCKVWKAQMWGQSTPQRETRTFWSMRNLKFRAQGHTVSVQCVLQMVWIDLNISHNLFTYSSTFVARWRVWKERIVWLKHRKPSVHLWSLRAHG